MPRVHPELGFSLTVGDVAIALIDGFQPKRGPIAKLRSYLPGERFPQGTPRVSVENPIFRYFIQEVYPSYRDDNASLRDEHIEGFRDLINHSYAIPVGLREFADFFSEFVVEDVLAPTYEHEDSDDDHSSAVSTEEDSAEEDSDDDHSSVVSAEEDSAEEDSDDDHSSVASSIDTVSTRASWCRFYSPRGASPAASSQTATPVQRDTPLPGLVP